MKDGSFLVVTPSSILNSATRRLDADPSFDEGFEEVIKDSEDEPVMRTRVSDSDEDDGSDKHETEAMGMCLLSLTYLLFLFFL